MPTPGADASGWEDALLKALKCPVVPSSSLALSLWAASEGMPSYANNWLATEKPGYGGYLFNKAGVYVYPTFAAGIAATAATIAQHNMAGILTALRKAAPMSKIYDAINASPWCKGCQHGTYPVALLTYITQHPSTVPGGPTTPPPPGSAPPFPVQGPTQAPDFDWSGSIRQTAKSVSSHAAHIHSYAQAIGKL